MTLIPYGTMQDQTQTPDPLRPELVQAGRGMWNWLHMDMDLDGGEHFPYADAIIVCGNNLSSMAERAAQVYQAGVVRFVVCSGGMARKEFDGDTEADYFANRLEELGIPPENIIREGKAMNTAENMQFSMELISDRVLKPSRIILVTAGQAERRVYATGRKKLDNVSELLVTSPPDNYDEFMVGKTEFTLSVLMGHVARIRAYAHKGDLEQQEISREAIASYDALLKEGVVPNGYYTSEGELGSLARDLDEAGEGLNLRAARSELNEGVKKGSTEVFAGLGERLR